MGEVHKAPFYSPLFYRKIVEMERFVLRVAILVANVPSLKQYGCLNR